MSLTEGKDYYVENGKYVFTSQYLLKRGYCCNCGCRHCPYKEDESKKPNDKGFTKEKEK